MPSDDRWREGKTYQRLHDNPEVVEWLDNGTVPYTYVAHLWATSVADVSRSYAAFVMNRELTKIQGEWEMEPEFAAMLPMFEIGELRRLGEKDWSPEHERLMKVCVVAFWAFEHEFFTIGSRGDTFIIKAFHEEIVYELIYSFVFATQLLVLTPPRHGKSEVMLRHAAWILIMYPNLQLLWVAANQDLAGQMTSKLKGVFQFSDKLKKAFLPPGILFGDEGAPKWRGDSFTLYTRLDKTLKSPSFTALGSTSTVAGRDVDYGYVDDLEERKTVATKDLRMKSRQKHAEIMERKENHTGICTIASRQHTDDIPNHLMQEEGDDAWKVLIYPAHDEHSCEADPDVYEDHVECMLMPEIRDYRWLMKMQTETEALGLPGRFPLRYLQKPVPLEGVVFDMALIREQCLDRSRGLGMEELPAMRLIAGLDPAARGQQVAFLWGWDGITLYMIDFERIKAGGVMGAVWVMAKWAEEYDLTDWIHEDNAGQIDAWRHVEPYKKVIAEYSLNVKPHTTGMNKHDPETGVSSMAAWYHVGRINLPYGTPTARRKVRQLLNELELWSSDGMRKKGTSDIKMAHWFPFPRIQRWFTTEKKPKLELVGDQSYPGIESFNDAPWGSTTYPGG